jgi:hypothetical protein
MTGSAIFALSLFGWVWRPQAARSATAGSVAGGRAVI